MAIVLIEQNNHNSTTNNEKRTIVTKYKDLGCLGWRQPLSLEQGSVKLETKME